MDSSESFVLDVIHKGTLAIKEKGHSRVPHNRNSPLVGLSIVPNILSIVVLPPPDVPKITTNSPRFIVKLTPLLFVLDQEADDRIPKRRYTFYSKKICLMHIFHGNNSIRIVCVRVILNILDWNRTLQWRNNVRNQTEQLPFLIVFVHKTYLHVVRILDDYFHCSSHHLVVRAVNRATLNQKPCFVQKTACGLLLVCLHVFFVNCEIDFSEES